MAIQNLTSKKYLRGLKILHILLLLFPFIIISGAYYLYAKGLLGLQNSGNSQYIFIGIAFFVAVLSVSQGIFMYRKTLHKVKTSNNLLGKLIVFRTAVLVRYALLEGSTLLAAVAFIYTFNLIALGLAVALFVYFASLFPTAYKIMAHLDLNEKERILLNDPNAVISSHNPS